MPCKIKTCKEKHDAHYCWLCGAKDDHFSSHCPKSKTLYHGTAANVVAPITIKGFKGSTHGNLGPGVYFVEEQLQAQKIGERKGAKSAVFKCKVNLGKLIDTGNKQCSDWQHNGYDSATKMHPAWCGIEHPFREYCLKESKKKNLVVTSIFINGKQIMKDENKTWGEARDLIQNLRPEASDQMVIQIVNQIGQLPDVKTNLINGKRIRSTPILTYLRQHWYLVIKTLLILFHLCNGIWSISHLFSEYNSKYNFMDDMKKSLISYALFFCFLFVARISLLIYHFVMQTDPMKYVMLFEALIAFILEMPMMVSQAYVLKSIPEMVWSKFTWDVAMQFQFHFNLNLFLTMDVLILAFKEDIKYAASLPIVYILLTGLCAAPVHWTILGWNLKPQLSDFGGSLGNGKDIINLLNFLMYIGCTGVWVWTVFLSVLALCIVIVIGIVIFTCIFK